MKLTLENPWTQALIEMTPAQIVKKFGVEDIAHLVDPEILYELEGFDDEKFVVKVYEKIGRKKFSTITLGA